MFKRIWAPILLLTVGCASQSTKADLDPATIANLPPTLQPIDVERMAMAFPGDQVLDPPGWAQDLKETFDELGLISNIQNTCVVAAIIENESGFTLNPPVEKMEQMIDIWADEQIFRYAPRGGGSFDESLDRVLNTAAHGQSQSFLQRLNAAENELAVHQIYDELVRTFQFTWPRAFEVVDFAGDVADISPDDFNPMNTAGCMQVPVDFIRVMADELDQDLSKLREEVYTRKGCLNLGVRRALDYQANYESPLFQFADYRAGQYASRNAAFQDVIRKLTGRPIPVDGRLLIYEGNGDVSMRPSPTLLGLVALRDRYAVPLSETRMTRDLSREFSAGLEETNTWTKVHDIYEQEEGASPYAQIPETKFRPRGEEQEKSVAWFANQVNEKYNTCLLRIGR